MPQKTLNKTALNKIKKAAKNITKQYPLVKHSQALEIVAKQEGFENYRAVQKAYKSNIDTPSAISPTDKILRTSLTLMDKIFEITEFGSNVADQLEEDISIKDIKDLHLDVFRNGIDVTTKTFGNLFYILGYSFNKEAIKEAGYKLLASNDSDKKMMGLLYIALSHFYRSAQNSTTYPDVKHPSFETYLTDWLRSLVAHDEQRSSVSYLCSIFPENEIPKMKNGSTHWPS